MNLFFLKFTKVASEVYGRRVVNDIKGVFRVSVLVLIFVVNANCCLDGSWSCFAEDLLSDICPVLSSVTSSIKDLLTLPTITDTVVVEEPLISADLVKESLKHGQELSREARKRGNQLVRSGVNLESCSPGLHHFFSSQLSPETKRAAEASHDLIAATKVLQMKLYSSSKVTPNTFLSFLEHQVIRVHDPLYCRPATVTCHNDKYRSIDGSCNNLQHPTWGRKGAPFTRIASPRYADGIYSMPVARSGRQLPNARLLSTHFFPDYQRLNQALTFLNMQWGQFVTHDLSLQVMEVTDEGGIQCCVGDGQDMLPPDLMNDKCIPISVPDDDPFYRYHGIKCLNFVRSITTNRDECSLGYADQMNTVTSFLDGSLIYGSDPKLAYKLRSLSGGKLKETQKSFSRRGFLPSVDNKAAVCDLRNMSGPCYLAGDVRINQTPTLALLHTLLLREHNRVASILATLNPLWADERLYQEARMIVIAEIQHITYQEWLPLNFGENYLRYYRISPMSLYSRDYSEEVNPGTINAFAAAAFRFLHTLIPDSFYTCPDTYQTAYKYKLSDYFFNPSLLEQSASSFDDVMRGILFQSSWESGLTCTSEVTNLLFKSTSKTGLDLIAMDIQRGRDHGIASYNDYREICGIRRAATFQDLAPEIPQHRITALSQMYECVDDIDLFVGGAMEQEVQGSKLGHTFQCIVAEQFYRTRIGDRFFYDNSEMPHSFTVDQLRELKKASMARLICDNTEVAYVQRRAFEVESQYNPKYSCYDYEKIPYVDLTPWRKSAFDL